MSVVVSTPNLRKPLSSSTPSSTSLSHASALTRKSSSSFASPMPRSPLSSYVNHSSSSHYQPKSSPITIPTSLSSMSMTRTRSIPTPVVGSGSVSRISMIPSGSPTTAACSPSPSSSSFVLSCRNVSEPIICKSSSSIIPSSPIARPSLTPCTPPQLRTPTRAAGSSSAANRAECRVMSSMASPRVAVATTQSPRSVKRAYSLFTPLSMNEACNDRYIPSRDSTNIALRFDDISVENNTPSSTNSGNGEFYDPLRASFDASLREALLDDAASPAVLSLRAATPTHKPRQSLAILDHESITRGAFQRYRHCNHEVRMGMAREIGSTPERVLDAPEIMDDFYTNVLDWSSQNRVAIGLGNKLYQWMNTSDPVTHLLSLTGGNMITSVKWSQQGDHIAVGTSDNMIQLWDVTTSKCVRHMEGHLARVTALDWNQHILSSGARDALILHHDIRSADPYTSVLRGHTQEICGLKWSPDGTQLASGANDNTCMIWEAKADTPRFTLSEHKAAVKAMAWCPWQSNLLATGGGTADRHIRFWNTSTGTCMNAIDTDSQVCGLVWSTHTKEILSAHGFSQNQLTVWKYPTMQRMKSLTGHSNRILHTAISPDGTTVCSAAADETLRFWSVWDAPKKRVASSTCMMAMESSMMIR